MHISDLSVFNRLLHQLYKKIRFLHLDLEVLFVDLPCIEPAVDKVLHAVYLKG